MTEDLRNEAHVALQNTTPLMRLNIGGKKARIKSDHECSVIHPKHNGSGIFRNRWTQEERV